MEVPVDDIARCVPGEPVDASHVSITGPSDVAASAFDVDGILTWSSAFALAAIDSVGASNGLPHGERAIDRDHLLAFCTTHVELDGAPVPAWAELSGVYPTHDSRHFQIHCNFPHHAGGVVRRLGCASTRESVASAIAERDADDLEAELIADGMIGAVVRTLDEWNDHEHAAATNDLPLVSVSPLGPAEPRRAATEAVADSSDPLAGVRVLDCSRVLAGPVAGQLLAAGGADVLRLGAGHLPTVPVGVMSTGFGKRSASLDLRDSENAGVMDALLDGTDVWIDAFRPGALDRLGFAVERAARRRPGIVVVQISAFDWIGPWAGRRGFDSIVQSTTGVRWAGGEYAVDEHGAASGDGPRGLPVQALDYATGFLAAGMASALVAHQRREGGSWLARLSLLRTRNWLVGRRAPMHYEPRPVTVDPRWLTTVESDYGALTTVRPLLGPVRSAPPTLGSSQPVWPA